MCDLHLNSLGWNKLDEDLNSLSGKFDLFQNQILKKENLRA